MAPARSRYRKVYFQIEPDSLRCGGSPRTILFVSRRATNAGIVLPPRTRRFVKTRRNSWLTRDEKSPRDKYRGDLSIPFESRGRGSRCNGTMDLPVNAGLALGPIARCNREIVLLPISIRSSSIRFTDLVPRIGFPHFYNYSDPHCPINWYTSLLHPSPIVSYTFHD